jgi:hypothetical protein
MSWTTWRAHFEANAVRPLPAVDAPQLDPLRTQALVHSLAIFQLGESGEGRIANQIDRVHLDGTDGDYRVALKRFVAEEGRHARILGQMLRGLGGRELQSNWTEALFRNGRRLMGVRTKLLVLMCAEVVGMTFYRLILERLPQSGLRSALEQICQDETEHLAFHAAFFHANLSPAERQAWRGAWWSVCGAALTAVRRDHRETLRAFGVSDRELLRSARATIEQGERWVIEGAPAPRVSASPARAAA